jgi:type I restriction enzyme S subunit
MSSDVADLTPRILGDLVTLQRGTTYKSELLGKTGPVLLGLASIERNGGFRSGNLRTYGGECPDRMLLRPGDLYVALKDVTQTGDLLGAVARVPDDISLGRLTQDTVKLVPKADGSWQIFLYWLLRSPEYRAYCRARAMGTTNLSLSRQDFLSFPVPARTDGRRALVQALEALSETIASNRRLAQGIERTVAAIFASRFGGGADGSLSLGWAPGVLAEIAQTHREFVRGQSELPYLGLDDMPRGSTVLEDWMSEDGPTGQSALFDIGDILFGKLRPYFHKVAVAPVAGRCSTEIVILRPKAPEMYGVVLGHVASRVFIDHCVAVSRGTKMPRAEWSDAGTFRIAVPPTQVAAEFTGLTVIAYQKIRQLILASRAMRTLRRYLLTKLVPGDEVHDADDEGGGAP